MVMREEDIIQEEGDNEGQEQLQGPEQVTEQQEAGTEEEAQIKKVEQAHGRMKELRRGVEVHKKALQSRVEGLNSVRQTTGTEGEDTALVADQERIADLERQQHELQDHVDGLEKIALDLPEDGFDEDSLVSLDTSIIPEIDQAELERLQDPELMKNERQEFIENWKEDSIKHILNAFESDLSNCHNGEKMTKLIALKMNLEITEKSQEYIETGSDQSILDLNFMANLRWSYYDTPEGRVQYAVDFSMDFGLTKEYFDHAMKEKALDEDEQASLDKAKEDGDLVEGN
jgi:hypothetical protein